MAKNRGQAPKNHHIIDAKGVFWPKNIILYHIQGQKYEKKSIFGRKSHYLTPAAQFLKTHLGTPSMFDRPPNIVTKPERATKDLQVEPDPHIRLGNCTKVRRANGNEKVCRSEMILELRKIGQKIAQIAE